jgi:hypothetical protein
MLIQKIKMDIQFEITKIESYSRALAEKLCNGFFHTSEVIKGEHILKFTSIDQVNLLVIKNLLDKWKEESLKLKSPYFNYDSNEVKEALQSLMNKLSQNISIRKEFFKPLLEKAIFDTLYLIIKPDGFFANEYSNKAELTLVDFKETEKYFKIHKGVIQNILKQAEREKRSQIKGYEFAIHAERLLKENPLDRNEMEEYLRQFSDLLQLELNYVNSLLSEENKGVKTEEQKVPIKSAVSVNATLNEKFVGEQLTVNDLLKSSQNLTLAEKIGRGKVESIKGAISLSQKFLFINSLFKGGNTEFESALNDIDSCSNYDEALNLLNQNYASKFNWNFDQNDVKEFVEIVERKFS